MPIVRTAILGTAFNDSATFDNEGLRDKGSVNQEVVRVLEHEGICGKFCPFSTATIVSARTCKFARTSPPLRVKMSFRSHLTRKAPR